MIAIGSYIVFIMSVMGTIFAAPDLSNQEKNQFYDYILQEHNEYRKNINLKTLIPDHNTYYRACQIVNAWMKTSEVPNEPGVNTCSIELKNISKLDVQLAEKIVAYWYNTGKHYNYDVEPTSEPDKAVPFETNVLIPKENFGVKMEESNEYLYIVTLIR